MVGFDHHHTVQRRDHPKFISSVCYSDPLAVDEKSLAIYTTDDIRLCTITQNALDQPLGFDRFYHRHERFHYIKLTDNYQVTLAYRAGLKSFDRLIEINEVNVQNDTVEQLNKRFNERTTLTLRLLVCDPTTYEHHQKKKKIIRHQLPTVKRLDPVSDGEY